MIEGKDISKMEEKELKEKYDSLVTREENCNSRQPCMR